MFFFFQFADHKKVDERIEANGGKEAVDILKKRRDALGIKNADVAAMLDENKSGASRYFNRNMKITAERTQRTARALGGILRLENQDLSNEQLTFSTETDSFADLIMQIQDEESQDEMDYLAACELPLAIINEVGIDSRDYIIKSSPQKRLKGLILTPDRKPCWIKFINRFYSDIEFSVLILPDMGLIGFRIGVSDYPDDIDYEDIKNYKRILEVDEAQIKEYCQTMGSGMSSQYKDKTIYGIAITVEAGKETIYNALQTAFGKYSTLLSELTGTVQTRNTTARAADSNVPNLPAEIKEAVLEDRKVACEVDATHELFEGIDGKPYVEIIPFIPINERMKQRYGQKLISKANAAILCPLCQAKLKHGSQAIREEVILKLYDKRIKELRAAGLDISRTEILFSRFLEDEYKSSPSLQRLLQYAKFMASVNEEGGKHGE